MKSLLQVPNIEGVELRRPAHKEVGTLPCEGLALLGTLLWDELHRELGGDPVGVDEQMGA